jgi:outer membrane protein TolC
MFLDCSKRYRPAGWMLACLCGLVGTLPAPAADPVRPSADGPHAQMLPPTEFVAQPATPAPAGAVAPERLLKPPRPVQEQPGLSLGEAVAWALENNPALMALRQQHGIAAAGVVVAHTYPFNPIWEDKTQANNGPVSAGITSRVATEHLLLLELELRGQGGFRRQEASANLSRTDWEIAAQEQALAVLVIRAYQNVVYQQERLRLIEQTIRLNEQLVQETQKLFNAGKVRGADLILARTEVEDARSLLGPGRTAVVTATAELRRALGIVNGPPLVLDGKLDMAAPVPDVAAGTEEAFQRRPDLFAHRAAVAQAEAAVRLEIANRFGNPTVGPAYTYDPTRINEIGAQINLPVPVFNTRRGQIQQRQAEQTRAVLELRQTEIQIRQDVEAALNRLASARAAAEVYRTSVLPSFQTALEGIEKLFVQGEPGVDVLRIIDMRRKLIRARDSYLGTLWEVSQARADLVAAIGSLGVAGLSCTPPPVPADPRRP